MSKNSIIDLNNQQYSTATAGFAAANTTSPANNTKTIDGFRPVAQRQAQHITAHQQEQPKTLMRRAVQRPDLGRPTSIKANSAVPISIHPVAAQSMQKLSAKSVDVSRLNRAQQIQRPGTINRFTNDVARPVITQTADSNSQHNVHVPQPSVVQSASPANPVINPQASRQPSQAVFERAMASATNHQQPTAHHRGVSKTKLSLLSAAFVAVFVAGFIMYRSVPSLTLGLASARAGFHASLPSYQPSGYSVGKIVNQPNTVIVNYKSNSDNRTYNITQKDTDWSSQMLLDNFVGLEKSHQTYNVGGRTVYLYGQHQATWVDGGIWYVVDGNTSLSDNQLLKMAGSL